MDQKLATEPFRGRVMIRVEFVQGLAMIVIEQRDVLITFLFVIIMLDLQSSKFCRMIDSECCNLIW